MRNLYRLVLFPFVLTALVISAAGNPPRAVEVSSDAVLTQELKDELSQDLKFHNVTVSVDTRIATLEGSVEDYRDKLAAEYVAREHRRIEGIRDFITVVPIVEIADRELQTKLAERLQYEGIDHGSGFNNLQLAVKEGIVTVSGQVRSYPDKASALAIVEDAAGVRDVKDEIRVLPVSPLDDDLRFQTAKAIYGDSVLRKYILAPQGPIRIVVEDGHVKLYGIVDNTADKHIAELRAREVSGIFSVENNLAVANSCEQKLADSGPSVNGNGSNPR